MDIERLKQAVEGVISNIEQEGRLFKFVGLIPAYPGVDDTSYIVQAKADWIENHTCDDGARYLVSKLYQWLDTETLKYIDRVAVYKESGRLHCMSEFLILRNKINYDPSLYARLYQLENA